MKKDKAEMRTSHTFRGWSCAVAVLAAVTTLPVAAAVKEMPTSKLL